MHYIRAIIARFSGDLTHTVSFARQALALLPEAEVIPRAAAIPLVGYAYQISGDVTLATEHEVVTMDALIRSSGNPFVIVGSITMLARLYALQGRLHLAAATYRQVTQAVPQPEILQIIVGSLSYYFGLGDLLREWNELDMAEQHLAQGMALINEALTVEPVAAMLGYTALARLQQARGNTREAFATLDALAQVAEQRHFPLHLISQEGAVRAQLELAQGNLVAAIHWADTSGMSAEDDDLHYPGEGAYLALARVRIAQGRDDPGGPFLQDALRLLDRLQESAETKARLGSVLAILL